MILRNILALTLYFLIVVHKASCQTLKGLEIYEDMVEFMLLLQVFLTDDPEIEYVFCCTPSCSYGVHIPQLIRFARVSSHVVDFYLN